MMSDFDLSAYLGVFLDEVDEQLQILDSEILNLEKDPHNMETIQNIFRAAHTLKGSSAAMGFEKLKEFTHQLENVFEKIRQQNLSVTSALINVIFESIDQIRSLKDAILEGTLEQVDTSRLVHLLMQYETQMHTEELEDATDYMQHLDEYQRSVVINAMQEGYKAYAVHIILQAHALMKNVRALLIHNHLIEKCEIIATEPVMEQIEDNELFDGDMIFTVLTNQSKEQILKQIEQQSDIDSVIVKEFEWITENVPANIYEVQQTLPNDIDNQVLTSKAKVASTVRVDVDKLEHLMNLVGELVIDQTRLVDVRGRFAEKNSSYEDEFEILDDVTNHLNRVITELQEGMMKTRMLPIEQLFNRFPRMVRDTAMRANKEIEFVMEGKETELDRTLIEEISDPIIHLLRNAIDHGIEHGDERIAKGKAAAGKIILRAAHEENNIVISIQDDGNGINPQKIKETSIAKGVISEETAEKLDDKEAMLLIFNSGISTAKEITDISGRGVGMDIVKSHIEKLNGIIDIESTVNEGTVFTIKLPLTLAIIRSLLVKFGSKTFAIPLVNVLEIIRLNKEDIQVVNDQEVGMVRGRILPLVRMKEKLGIQEDNASSEQKKREFVVVVGLADKRIGIIADSTLGNQEIVIKSLGSYIGAPPFISGATIMGDGSVALILDISSVVRDYGAQIQGIDNKVVTTQMEEDKQLVTFKLADEEYGIEIHRAKDIISVPHINKVAEASNDLLGIINLRGNMLPVFDLRKKLNLPQKNNTKKSRIIVVEHATQDVGYLVDEVTQVLKVNQVTLESGDQIEQYHKSKLIKGISKIDERVIFILQFEKIAMESNVQITN